MRIYLIDDGRLDKAPGLVKEIVRTEKVEVFDLVHYTDKFGQEGYYVLDTAIDGDIIIYKLVTRMARIAEKRE